MERVFIGLKIPSIYTRMISQLYGTSIENEKRWKNCKWVGEENLHLTLSFIGEISSDKRQVIQEALRTISFTSFPLKIVNKIETFPEKAKKNIRVLHLPLIQSHPQENAGKPRWSAQLENLKQSIDEVLVDCEVSIESAVLESLERREMDNNQPIKPSASVIKEEEVIKTEEIDVSTSKLVGSFLNKEDTSLRSMEASLSCPKGQNSKKKKERFHPHLTISRVKQNCKVAEVHDLVEQMNKVMNDECDPIWNEMIFSVEEFFLFRSTLTPKGPIYDMIESYRCKET